MSIAYRVPLAYSAHVPHQHRVGYDSSRPSPHPELLPARDVDSGATVVVVSGLVVDDVCRRVVTRGRAVGPGVVPGRLVTCPPPPPPPTPACAVVVCAVFSGGGTKSLTLPHLARHSTQSPYPSGHAPMGHAAHADMPAASVYFPAGHSSQAMAPASAAKATTGGHGLHGGQPVPSARP
jgi:hypothetical protein